MKTASRLVLPLACLALVSALHFCVRMAAFHDDAINISNDFGWVVVSGIIVIWMERRARKKPN